ncbi:hypothetical protein BKA80DRAFT_340155 [Phyllosticta citrichinensis]
MDPFIESLLNIIGVWGALQNILDAEDVERYDDNDSSSSGSETDECRADEEEEEEEEEEGANDHDADDGADNLDHEGEGETNDHDHDDAAYEADARLLGGLARLPLPLFPLPLFPSSSTVAASIDAIEAFYEVDCAVCTYFSYYYSCDYEALFAYCHGEV